MASEEGAPATGEPTEVKNEAPPSSDNAAGGEPGTSMAPSTVNSMDGMTAEGEEKSNVTALRYFIYNPKTGRVLGRSGMSWLRLLIFYLLYYFFIFCYFFLCLVILIQFSGENKPDMTTRSPVILGTATGLSVFPTAPKTSKARQVKDRVRSTTIYYSINVDSSWQVYSRRLNKIEDDINQYNVTGAGDCTAAKNYGYDIGKPCVLLRFNRVFDWIPKTMANLEKYLKETYKEDALSRRDFMKYKEFLQRHPNFDLNKFLNEYIGIRCTPEGGEETTIGSLTYFPAPGIKVSEFKAGRQLQSFRNQRSRWNWTPHIFVQFNNPRRNTFIPVICKAFEQDMDLFRAREGVGAVRFSLYIKDDGSTP